jgi:ArsR family transcriptional regulator
MQMIPRLSRSRVARACVSLDGLLATGLFRALSDPNRARLVVALAGKCGDSSVGELAECLTVDVSVVSRHLARLREAGVLHAHRQGKEVRYSILFSSVAETLRRIADAIDECCPRRAGVRVEGRCVGGPARVSVRSRVTDKREER